MRNTGLLGDFTKGFVIMVGALWVFIIIEFIIIKQIVVALLLLFVLTIPLSMIAYEYLRKSEERENLVDD